MFVRLCVCPVGSRVVKPVRPMSAVSAAEFQIQRQQTSGPDAVGLSQRPAWRGAGLHQACRRTSTLGSARTATAASLTFNSRIDRLQAAPRTGGGSSACIGSLPEGRAGHISDVRRPRQAVQRRRGRAHAGAIPGASARDQRPGARDAEPQRRRAARAHGVSPTASARRHSSERAARGGLCGAPAHRVQRFPCTAALLSSCQLTRPRASHTRLLTVAVLCTHDRRCSCIAMSHRPRLGPLTAALADGQVSVVTPQTRKC